jgi:hypothetical protein
MIAVVIDREREDEIANDGREIEINSERRSC